MPGDALATVQFKNPTRHIIKEIAVVGHCDDSALVLPQVHLQPLYGFRIQMVCRLVK